MAVESGSTLRVVVLAAGIVEAAILIAFVLMMLHFADTSDPQSRSIGLGMAQLAAIPVGVLVLPAIVLGYWNRWLPVALGLLGLAAPISIFLWLFA